MKWPGNPLPVAMFHLRGEDCPLLILESTVIFSPGDANPDPQQTLPSKIGDDRRIIMKFL
jgi:hypothetical protein